MIFLSLFKDIFLEVRDEKWSSGSDLFGQIGYGAYLPDKIKIFLENRIFPDFRDFWARGCELVFWQCLASRAASFKQDVGYRVGEIMPLPPLGKRECHTLAVGFRQVGARASHIRAVQQGRIIVNRSNRM